MEETIVHYNVFVLAIARCVMLNTGSNMVYRIELLGVSEVDYIDQSEINILPYHLWQVAFGTREEWINWYALNS